MTPPAEPPHTLTEVRTLYFCLKLCGDLREISKIFQMYYKCSNNMWLIHFHIFRRVFRKHNVRIIYLISDTWY